MSYPDSNSPWSTWLVDRLLDREWLASDLAEASGGVFNTAQVSRWLHSQDVPEPFMAMLAAQACDASVIDALRAAEHGVLVDTILDEHAEKLKRLAKCPCGCPVEGNMCVCGPGACGCSPSPGCAFCDSPNDPPPAAQRKHREELKQAARERDEDVRTVDRAIGLLKLLRGPSVPPELYNVICLLVARYGGRIEELSTRDSQGGE